MRRLTVLWSLLLAVTSCGGDMAASPAPAVEPVPEQMSATAKARTDGIPVADAPAIAGALEEDVYPGFEVAHHTDHTLVAIALGELDVYQSPGSAEPFRTLAATTILGTATVVTGLGQPEKGWLEVMLPGRPNGSQGWVETDSVDIYMVTDRVVIDLSDRELSYYQDGAEKLSTTVAIGTSHNPTPIGTFFVTDLVDIPGGGPWGPAALGLSARSETITEFNGGDGIIGIHGTNKPGSIGQAASLGCVRLPNDVIVELRSLVSLGTPVEIRA